MDEENAAKIVEREANAFVCEEEQEHIDMDGAGDGESHCDETHVDDDYKVGCEIVNPATTDEYGEIEIINQHMHAQISHNRVDENYVMLTLNEDNLTGDEWLHMMQQK